MSAYPRNKVLALWMLDEHRHLLTPRSVEVLGLVKQGIPYRTVAKNLGISRTRVEEIVKFSAARVEHAERRGHMCPLF